jgi:hypothetical protein
MNIQVPVGRQPELRYWPDFHTTPSFLVPRRRLLTPETKIFTMGSCFALELRTVLMAGGYRVYPDYVSVPYDRTQQIYDRIPERYALSHFDTFNMRQELEAALGLWGDRSASFCRVHNAPVNDVLKSAVVYQDPLRKLVYATSFDLLLELSRRIDDTIRRGLEEADIYVLTLGLTEVWRHKTTGRWLCMAPGSALGGAEGLGIFHRSTFAENLDNVRAILNLLFERYPGKTVILSVSPVHLESTFTDIDVGTASTESKAILRAVAGEVTRADDRVVYFPAYEMAHFWRTQVFNEDGRHVTRDFAARVVAAFLGAFS